MTSTAGRTPFLELGIVNDGTGAPAFDEAIIWAGEIYEIHIRGESAGTIAEKIVRAANSHEVLVKALESLLDDKHITYGVRVQAARAVLAAIKTGGAS